MKKRRKDKEHLDSVNSIWVGLGSAKLTVLK
jgi:hypothetical protein